MSEDIVKVYCPECNKSYKVKKAVLGKKTTCKQCSTRFELKLKKKVKAKPKIKEEVQADEQPLAPQDQQDGDPNGLKFCPTCELQTEHRDNVCTVCEYNNTGKKPLLEKIKSHPFLSKEIKTPVGTLTMLPLLGGVLLLVVAGASIFLFMGGEDPKPKKQPKVAVVAKKTSPKKVEKEPIEIEEKEEETELLPEYSVFIKQATNFRTIPYKQIGDLVIGLTPSPEVFIIENKNEEMSFLRGQSMGTFRKFRFSLFQLGDSGSTHLTSTQFDDTMENVIFYDFENELEGSLKKEEDQWLFVSTDGRRPRKINGVLLNQNKSLLGLINGIKGTNVICYPIDAATLKEAGQWVGEMDLQDIIK